MFERFSQRTREVITAAQSEASDFRHDYVGAGHLLIGLSRDDGGAGRVLVEFGLESETVRREIVAISGYGEEDTSSKPFTPPSKKVLESARDNANGSGRYWIAPEDLLLALTEQAEGVAAGMLARLEIEREALGDRLQAMLPDDSDQR